MESKKKLVIFYNDLIDSDNWAAARFLHDAATRDKDVMMLWIIEPRRVALGYAPTPDEERACDKLLGKHFPNPDSQNPVAEAFKTRIGGRVTEEGIATLKKSVRLTPEEEDLLRLAIPPSYDSEDIAYKHGQLLVADFCKALSAWSGTQAPTVYVARAALRRNINPVNLKAHVHEELVGRDEQQVKNFNTAMNQPDMSRRRAALQAWYDTCLKNHPFRPSRTLRSAASCQEDLSVDMVADMIKAAEHVRYFGGASLMLLEDILKRPDGKALAQKMECYIQGGFLNPRYSLFTTQFNFLLNKEAARYVLSRYRDFKSIRAAPSDATGKILYDAQGMTCGGDPILLKQILGFNVKADPVKIASGEVNLETLSKRTFKMPDLTAFLCLLQAHGLEMARFVPVEVNDTVTADLLLRKVVANGRGGGKPLEVAEIGKDDNETILLTGEKIKDILGSFTLFPVKSGRGKK